MQRSHGRKRSLILLLAIVIAACTVQPAGRTDTAAPEIPATSAPSVTVTDADSAVAVIRRYYQSITERRFADAYQLWSDSGRASGQSLEDFERGFDETASVQVETATPGRVEPAAGSRYITIPVKITATSRSGEVQRYTGSYDLRRSVVDGASADQRAWRIYSAKINRDNR